MIKTISAIAATVALGAGLTQVDIDALRDSAAESAAHASIQAVFIVAASEAALAGVPFDLALQQTVSASENSKGTLSVEGTSLVWELGDNCFVSKFVDELTWVAPVRCPLPT
jgi:hypothetical protein